MKWPFEDAVTIPAVLGNVLQAAVHILKQQLVDGDFSSIASRHRSGNQEMECD